MRNKKGLSQIDWIISLTLFIFYLIWFFIFAIPMITPPTETPSSFDTIYDNFRAETLWNVTKMPLIARSNISGSNELIYMDFTYAWNKNNTGFSDQRNFMIDENKIFFVANLSNGSGVFNIYNSDSNNTQIGDYGDITSTSTRTTINSMSLKADFSGSKLTTLQRQSDIPMDNTSYHINMIPFSSSKDIFTSTNISSKYTASSSEINVSAYLFARNYRILFFIYENGLTNTKSNFTLSSTIRPYPYYFANNEFKGDISYSSHTCKTVYYNSINFYGNTSGLTFLLPDNSKIDFCTGNNSFILNITMNVTNSSFEIVPFVGNYSNSLKYQSPYSAETGMRDIMNGLSIDKLNILNASSYAAKKSSWNFKGNDFTISVKNSSDDVILDFGTAPPETVNAYVDERDWWLQTNTGVQEKAVVNIRVW